MESNIHVMLENGYIMVKQGYTFPIGPFPQLRMTVPTVLPEPIIILIHEVHIVRETVVGTHNLRRNYLKCFAVIDPKTLIHGWYMQARYLLKDDWVFEDAMASLDYENAKGNPQGRAPINVWGVGE